VRQHHFCALTPPPSDPTPPSVVDNGSADAAPDAPGSHDSVQVQAPGTGPAPAAPGSEGFLPGTVAELGKVVWPSRQQLFSESVAVILMVGLSAAAIAALDRFLHWVSASTFPIR